MVIDDYVLAQPLVATAHSPGAADTPILARAPTIEAERLRLRAHRPSDLEDRVALYADGEAMRFVGGAQGREECWARIQRYAGHWALLGYGIWAVEAAAGGGLLGEVGLGKFERGLGEDFDLAIEAAWVVGDAGRGRGFAVEAMSAAIAWYEAAFGPTRMVCVIAHENVASLRVAAKLGFEPFGERDYKGAVRLLLARK